MKRLRFLIAVIAVCLGCSAVDNFEDLRRSGIHAYERGDYEKARERLLKAYRLNPSDRDNLYYLGLSYQMDAHYDSALHYLRLAEILNPDDKEIKNAVYQVAYALGDWENALQMKRELYLRGDDDALQHAEDLVELDSRTGRGMAAFYYARELLKESPDDPNRYLQFANACIIVDSSHLALRAMDSAIARFGPEDIFLSNKALYYAYRLDYDTAEAIFRALVARDTLDVAFKVNLANCLSSQEPREKKLEALEIYREIQPVVDVRHKVDSLIANLEGELGIQDTNASDTGK